MNNNFFFMHTLCRYHLKHTTKNKHSICPTTSTFARVDSG